MITPVSPSLINAILTISFLDNLDALFVKFNCLTTVWSVCGIVFCWVVKTENMQYSMSFVMLVILGTAINKEIRYG